MIKVIIQTILGILSSVVGIYVGYQYLSGLNAGASPLLLLLSLFFIGIGVFLFMTAGKSDSSVTKKLSLMDALKPQESMADVLKKNNALVSEWEDTNEKRDRLKMLEMSANSE